VAFNAKAANRAINFFERLLTHTKGREYAGQPFILAPWQKKIVSDLFGTLKKNGLRQYETAYIEIPKKNGKSELAAGIALIGLFIDHEPGAEIYSAAATRDQAAIVFRLAAQMVTNNPDLRKRATIIYSTKTIYLKSDIGSFYKAISADAGTQDGINPHFVIFDELHRQKKKDLWNVLTMGSDTRTQPLLFAITTAGVQGQSPLCWDQHEYARQVLQGIFKDSSFYPVIYTLPEEKNWRTEGKPATGKRKATGWFKANPALGDFLSLARVQTAAAKAKRIPSEQNDFRRFRLNQWVAQESRWIDLKDWNNCGAAFNPNDLLGKKCWAGLDLSTTRDITAFLQAFPIEDEIFFTVDFWLPEHEIEERSARDRVPYDVWAKQGLIHLTPGNTIDYAFIKKTITDAAELYDIQEVAYDPFNASQVCLELAAEGVPMIPFRQGWYSMNPACKEFERLVLKGSCRHGSNPVLNWMMDSTRVVQDPQGNIKPAKPDRQKTGKRIDGIVAAIMGVGRIALQQNEPDFDGSVFSV